MGYAPYPEPLVYEDVVFEMWYQEKVDSEPWACICYNCSDELLEGAGYGVPSVPSQCCIQGCVRTAECFITLVDA